MRTFLFAKSLPFSKFKVESKWVIRETIINNFRSGIGLSSLFAGGRGVAIGRTGALEHSFAGCRMPGQFLPFIGVHEHARRVESEALPYRREPPSRDKGFGARWCTGCQSRGILARSGPPAQVWSHLSTTFCVRESIRVFFNRFVFTQTWLSDW